MAIGFMQYATTKAEIEAGNIFRVNTKEQIPPRSICAVTASQYETPEPVQRFIDSLLEKGKREYIKAIWGVGDSVLFVAIE